VRYVRDYTNTQRSKPEQPSSTEPHILPTFSTPISRYLFLHVQQVQLFPCRTVPMQRALTHAKDALQSQAQTPAAFYPPSFPSSSMVRARRQQRQRSKATRKHGVRLYSPKAKRSGGCHHIDICELSGNWPVETGMLELRCRVLFGSS